MLSTIRLFRAVPITNKSIKKLDKELLKQIIESGFVLSPEVIGNYDKDALLQIIREVKELIGLNPEQMNSSFHKSWQKIKTADLEQLVVEQIAHYMTTYGKESPAEYLEEKESQWGVEGLTEKVLELEDLDLDKIYNKDYVYIPKEALDIPGIKIDKIELVIIKGYTVPELKEKLLNLLQSGIALAEDTINDVIDVALYVELSNEEMLTIKNKEVKIALYDYLGIIPENPIEFLRYIVYKATSKTLLIKDSLTIEEIKCKENLNILGLIMKYKNTYGLERLAEIFYRFKPLWLAFRTNRQLKKMINKIRKLAVEYHKPMPEDYLNEVTAKINKDIKINKEELKTELEKVNIFRKIRLAYALKFRTTNVESILYRIRNGKGFATEFSFTNKKVAQKVLDIVLNSIVQDIKKNIKGKKIFIPENITYALPATEKQFTGLLPSGTCVSFPKDMVVGVHWTNVKDNTIDLDLSLIDIDEKFGWDASYRSGDRDILFSGDLTNAPLPNGASELFYVKRQLNKAALLYLNYYNFQEIEVPFKIFVAREQVSHMKENYMINPNNIMISTESKINQRSKILGLLVTKPDESKFYFSEIYLGKSITSSNSEWSENSRKYLLGFYENTINLNDLLKQAGAEIVTEEEKYDINLSINKLEKDTIINLLI